jgi:large subunit ribosomal protein L4
MSEKVKTVKKKTATPKAKVESVGKDARVLTVKDLSLTDTQRRDMSPKSFAVCVRVLLQNWRQGTVAVKGRSDVAFSNKKPWRQKGTGRARAGSLRSPLWRKGGVCHGPQARTRVLSVTKDVRRGVTNALFWNNLENGNIICINRQLPADKPKTSAAYALLKDSGLQGKKMNLFVRADDTVTQTSFANIPHVRTLLFDQANVFDLATAKTWVVLEKDINAFKDMVNSWL